MSYKLKPIIFSILIVSSIASFACINDADTLFFESQRFPNETELMSGDFITHSKEFYIWRAEDRLKKLEKEPNNLSYYDDLAVSYEKSGQGEKAVETLEKVYKENPNRYETIANLGTFYIHNKQYEKGLELLKKAVIINPNAHFGREIYQIKIVEYILKENPDGNFNLPIQKSKESFADFILKDVYVKDNKSYYSLKNPEDLDEYTTEILKAMVGIGGMLKFGNSDSPILLEAMGDLYKKLNSLNSQYAANYETTYFGKIALLFYTAAVTRNNSKEHIEKSNYSNGSNKYAEKFDEYLKIKELSTTTYFDLISNSLERFNDVARKNKIEYAKKEIEYINKGGDVEKNIYTNLYPANKEQEDLFETSKKSYLRFLDESKNEYYHTIENKINDLKNKLYFNIYLFGIPLVLYYIICLPSFIVFLYRKYKKSENLSISKFKIKKIIKVTKYIILAYLIYNTLALFYITNWYKIIKVVYLYNKLTINFNIDN